MNSEPTKTTTPAIIKTLVRAEMMADALRELLKVDDGDEPLACKYPLQFSRARGALKDWDAVTK